MEQQAYSIQQFCKLHDISKAFFYILLKEGAGPTVTMKRRRRLISIEAAKAWRNAAAPNKTNSTN